jgi:hypothetical protein
VISSHSLGHSSVSLVGNSANPIVFHSNILAVYRKDMTLICTSWVCPAIVSTQWPQPCLLRSPHVCKAQGHKGGEAPTLMGLDPYVRRSRHHPHRTVQCQTGVEEGAPFLLRVQRKPAAEATPEQWPQYPELKSCGIPGTHTTYSPIMTMTG